MENKIKAAEGEQADKKEQKKEIKNKSKIEIKNEVVVFTLGTSISFNDESADQIYKKYSHGICSL